MKRLFSRAAVSKRVPTRARAMSDDAERRADEMAALVAIFGDSISIDASTARVVLRDDVNDSACCSCSLRFPERYPSSEPLEIASVSTNHLVREIESSLLARTRAYVMERREEVAWEALAELERLFREANAEERRRREAARSAEISATDEDEDHHAVVRIDHMNDSIGYMKHLKKFAETTGIAARVIHKKPDANESSKRVEGVFVALSGSIDGIKTFLTRLRTEFVDFDSKGVKCRERKATTLCLRKNSTVKEGERPVESFSGFETLEPYATEKELEDALARLHLLHVGDGLSRFA